MYTRRLSEIANEISRVWTKPYDAAVPYIEAMKTLNSMEDTYGADNAESIILYFLGNARTWRGPDARRIKAELNMMLTGMANK